MTREQELAIIERATTPRYIAREFECRLCGLITATREQQAQAKIHRPECPMIAVLEARP